jgi:hypothetical protein
VARDSKGRPVIIGKFPDEYAGYIAVSPLTLLQTECSRQFLTLSVIYKKIKSRSLPDEPPSFRATFKGRQYHRCPGSGQFFHPVQREFILKKGGEREEP